jgi:uncharacterized protein (DUF2164 family)
MRIRLSEERREGLARALQGFVSTRFDKSMSDFQAGELIDFFLRRRGPSVYNQAIQDARGYLQAKLDDLEGEFYEVEEQDPDT